LVEEKLIDYCNKKNIKIEAYSPIAQAKKLDDPVLKKLAAKYKKNTAQIMLRWGLQMGFIILPKSSDLKRIKDNANLFDFELSAQDMKDLYALKKKQIFVVVGMLLIQPNGEMLFLNYKLFCLLL